MVFNGCYTGIYWLHGGNLTVDNCSFYNNNIGIYADYAPSLVISNSLFERNVFRPVWAYHVGNFNMSFTKFINNRNGFTGGACFLRETPTVSLFNSSFIGNWGLMNGAAIAYENTLNLIVERCHFEGNSANESGSAAFGPHGTGHFMPVNITVIDSTFIGNTNIDSGAAVTIPDRSNATFIRCFFDQNTKAVQMTTQFGVANFSECNFTRNGHSNSPGAVMRVYGKADVLFDKCSFEGNNARSGAVGFFRGASVSYHSCYAASNVATTGAVLHDELSYIEIQSSLFRNNSGEVLYSIGNTSYLISDSRFESSKSRVIYVSLATDLRERRIINSTFEDIEVSGVLVFSQSKNITFESCTFRGNGNNVSTHGTFFLGSSEAYFSSCTFYNNTGRNGGAISTPQSSCYVFNSTFERNSARRLGGAIFSDRGSLLVDQCRYIFLFNLTS